MTALELIENLNDVFGIPFGEARGLSSNPLGLSSNPLGLSSNPESLPAKLDALSDNPKGLPTNPKSLPTNPHLTDEAARCLQCNSRHVRDTYLRPLMREGRLVMTNPDEPNDPQQTYRALGNQP